MPKGWHREPGRHSLASHGVETTEDRFYRGPLLGHIRWKDKGNKTKIQTIGDVSDDVVQEVKEAYEKHFTKGQKEDIGSIRLFEKKEDCGRHGEYSYKPKGGSIIKIFNVEGDMRSDFPVARTLLHESGHSMFTRLVKHIKNKVKETAGYQPEPVSDLINNPEKFKGGNEVFELFAELGQYIHRRVRNQEFIVNRDEIPESMHEVHPKDVKEGFADWWKDYKLYPNERYDLLYEDGVNLMKRFEEVDNK